MENIQKIQENNFKKILNINNSIWVSASAGSGKTTILVRRLLYLLVNDVDVSKIVCITYTKTGANEMKDRIYKYLSNWAVIDDNSLKKEIEKDLYINNITDEFLKKIRTLFAKIIDNIDNLKIFTIHSFCQQIISRFPIEAGIYPNFEIIDEQQSKTLIKSAIDEVILQSENDFYIHTCLENFLLEKNESDFQKLIDYVIGKRKEFEYLADFDYYKDLQKIFNITVDKEEDVIKDFWSYDYSKVYELADYVNDNDKLSSTIKGKLSNLKEIIAESDIDRYIDCFLTSDGTIRKRFEKLGEYHHIFLREGDRCIEYLQNLENVKYYNLTLNTINFGLNIIKKYKQLKKEQGLLDFDDLLLITFNLLKNSEYSAWVNYKLDSGIEHLLIDEAQDTSTLQWKIIEYLTGDFFNGETKENNRTIFVVGDEKQSIYIFQGANPDMFNDRFNFYRTLIEDSRNIFFKVDLKYSFRSLQTILKFVDQIFIDKIYTGKISKFEEKIEHYNVRNGTGLVEVWPLINSDKKEEYTWDINFDNDVEIKKQELLAKYIAEKIKYLVNSNRAIITRYGTKRKINYGDIMILLRKREPILLSYLMSFFNKNHIPNSGKDRIDLFDNIIIKDFISLFNFLVFKYDDLNLANIIKSPFMNLNEDDLLYLCRYKTDNKITLFESFAKIDKYKEQYNFLLDTIKYSENSTIFELCFYLVEKVKKNIFARYDGADIILTNFFDFISNYEKQNNSSLVDFISFINNHVNEIKKDFDSNNTNRVKIMTVHGSKGMQSPIVFLIDTNKVIDENNDEMFWIKNKYEYDIPIYKTNMKFSNILKSIKDSNSYSLHAEYFRLFYVAMTRAENELYICGVGNNKDYDIDQDKKETKNTWYDLSYIAMKNLNANKKVFDFDSNLTKFTFGNENFLDEHCDKITDKHNELNIHDIDNAEISNIIESVQVYKNHANKKVISPSQFYNYVDRDEHYDKINPSILKGNAIHKLLEVLPNSNFYDREKIADIYLNNYFYNLSNEDKNIVKQRAIKILNDEKFSIFYDGQNSRSEVAIVGNIDGFSVSGKIDRLIELDKEVLVLDYKNTFKHYKTVGDLPKEYIKQLELYKKLLEDVYTNKIIKCYILITSYSELIRVF